MRVIFFDDDDDEGRWDFDLPSVPRVGERVILTNRKIGSVTRVTWGIEGDTPYVEIIVQRSHQTAPPE